MTTGSFAEATGAPGNSRHAGGAAEGALGQPMAIGALASAASRAAPMSHRSADGFGVVQDSGIDADRRHRTRADRATYRRLRVHRELKAG